MTPFDPGYLGWNPLAPSPTPYIDAGGGFGAPAQTSPYIEAIIGLLHGVQDAQSAPRHYGPAEGPLGENAHLGWGQTPQTTATTRTAAPTRKTKLGGVVPPSRVLARHYVPMSPGFAAPPLGHGRLDRAKVIAAFLGPHSGPMRAVYY